MEDVEERLGMLTDPRCKVCGFTVNNASEEQQDRFLRLLPACGKLEVLHITELENFASGCGVATSEADQKRRKMAEENRREHKIDLHPERVAYFHAHILPYLPDIFKNLPCLEIISFLNIPLNNKQLVEIKELFSKHTKIREIIFENLLLRK